MYLDVVCGLLKTGEVLKEAFKRFAEKIHAALL
jgi:hypothetical protein